MPDSLVNEVEGPLNRRPQRWGYTIKRQHRQTANPTRSQWPFVALK